MAGPADAPPGPDGLDDAWEVHPAVSVREEDFGALLYHFGTRRLSFVTSLPLLGAVRALAGAPSAAAALDDVLGTDAPPRERAALERGLLALAAGGMVRLRGRATTDQEVPA
ncbi:mycofactocin biosynthesis chaperone MftB [Aquipuribacter sp. MA13-6]|uniref:mycofactocin biosynthesis chaperone MftB n=1 Tax=unclassified Aquipuribacter TaxID=2635084 RepID=UPI003EE883B7